MDVYGVCTPSKSSGSSAFLTKWTGIGMADAQRAFCLGNALIVGVVQRIGEEIVRRAA